VAFALLSFYLASNYYWFADERRYWVIGISYTYLLTQFLNAIFGFEITIPRSKTILLTNATERAKRVLSTADKSPVFHRHITP